MYTVLYHGIGGDHLIPELKCHLEELGWKVTKEIDEQCVEQFQYDNITDSLIIKFWLNPKVAKFELFPYNYECLIHRWHYLSPKIHSVTYSCSVITNI